MKFSILAYFLTAVGLAMAVAQQPTSTIVVQAESEPWQVVTINSVSLQGTLKDGTPFEVDIEAKKPKALQANYFGSANQPSSVVAGITVKVGSNKISFPKQAFDDLADASLQTVSVTSRPSGELKFHFTGGEEARRYEVEYFIQSNRLVKRSLSYFEPSPDGKKQAVLKTTTF